MAEAHNDEQAKTGDDNAQGGAPGKRRVVMAGAAVVAVALGAVFASMAVVKKPQRAPTLEGPFVAKLSQDEIVMNLTGEGSKRFLVLALKAEYFAYDEVYVAARLGQPGAASDGGETGKPAVEDPLYTAMLKDAILGVATTKTRDQVTDPMLIEAFLEELRRVIDPLLFPVCVGDSHAQGAPDSHSGVKVGESISRSTMRGFLHEHKLAIDTTERTVKLDGGAAVRFEAKDRDLRVENERGESVYVDMTALDPEFSGELPIGVPGKVRRLYREKLLVQ